MKQIPRKKRLKYKVSSVSLYIDDIEFITENAQRYNFIVEYSDEDFEYDTIEEIADNRGKKIKSIFIKLRPQERYLDLEIEYKDGTLKS